jgi:hypothetical protein
MCSECNRNVVATSLKRKIATEDQRSRSFHTVSGKKGFGGASDIIGKQIQVNSATTTVRRCDARQLAFPPGSNDQVELLLPFQFDPANPGIRGVHFLSVIGRLKPGVTWSKAQSEMTSLMAGWKSESRAQHLLNPNVTRWSCLVFMKTWLAQLAKPCGC